MEQYELQKLRDLPIEGVAERLGLRVVRHKALCPFHDDHHASLSFKVSKNTCRCFVCMTQSMGPIDLVMRHLRVDFRAACRWLADEHNIILEEENVKMKKCNNVKTEAERPFDASRYERFFERPWLNDEARKFLFDERRLDPRVVRWCRLTSWKDREGTPWLQTPYYDRDGRLVGVQNRNLSTSPDPSKGGEGLPGSECASPSSPLGRSGEVSRSQPRFRFPRGSRCGIYNLPVLNLLRPGDELYITEGCSDCWAMLSAGHKAIAIPSATLLTREDRELLKHLEHLEHFGDSPSVIRSATHSGDSPLCASPLCAISFHMYPDRDAPGERLFLQLQQVLPTLQHHQLPPGCKDFADYYRSRALSP